MVFNQLNEVVAGVIEHRHGGAAGFHGGLGEGHARRFQSFHLGFNVIDAKRRPGNAIRHQRFLQGARCGILIGFKRRFDAIRFVGGNEGQPAALADGNVVFDDESERVGVEIQNLFAGLQPSHS